ncbi:VOC family protein [Streptomyces durbertensis]|uniref:VOC family protein n=1 Tax=Streptomyces durbertensis TaxID=2448886 RepID=A0ABR6EKL7_9ACTN|nr:VOC family protein [Streptomyces durbertensis]MBB1245862.1 VOC family protein [Streptomyces durbertensis]
MPDAALGAPCWADVMLPDLAAGKRFYGGLFGWTFDESAEGADVYTPALLGGRRVAALGRKSDGRMPTAWTLYLHTPDMPATVERVRDAGGTLIGGPLRVGDGPAGVTAVVADPDGAVFGLWQPLSFAGFEVRDEPGSYLWGELYARDKETADDFYRAVFDYATTDISEEDADFLLWAPAGGPADAEHALGGRALVAQVFPAEMPPHFLTYFAVADCDEAVSRAGELGGRTVFPAETSQYGRFAVLVDNQGATFAVLDSSVTGQDG